ncbi:Rsp5p-dependent ubiquitination, sorting of cargo proteins at the multivesicular body [Mortierella sp. AD031]|nr:Rsp5p-dependent ubiquitination, sorting of cargo proteins at the multivesicular body [Mortierella sp. AD031]
MSPLLPSSFSSTRQPPPLPYSTRPPTNQQHNQDLGNEQEYQQDHNDVDDNGDKAHSWFDPLPPSTHYHPRTTYPARFFSSYPFNPRPTSTLNPYQHDYATRSSPYSQFYPAATPSSYPYWQDSHELDEDLPSAGDSGYYPSSSGYPYRHWKPTTTYPRNYPTYPVPYDSYLDTIREPYPDPYPTFTGIPPSTDPDRNDGEEEDLSWLVAVLLTTAFIISVVSAALRTCGQKASWLTGSSSSSLSSPSGSSSLGHHHRRNGGTGRGGRRGFGNALLVPDSEVDPETTPDRLNSLSDADRQAYDAAEAFQVVNPPNSVPTDISLSQYLSIQEKGVSAWEFEPSYDHQLYVHDRTELSFFDRVASVQTNLPLPKQQEVYYWEVKMFEKSPRTTIAIGVATKPYPSTRLPGWNRHSAGYFSNNGQKYCNSLWSGVPFGPHYFEGDVVGCGYRPRNGTIFFTRNGKRIDDAYTGYGRTNLFPTVGATGPCVLHINFGQSGFVFVEANVKKWGLAPASGSLAPPPAYGSELGSILLEAAGSGSRVPRFTGSSSSGSLAGGQAVGGGPGGRPIMQHFGSSRTRVSTANGGGGGEASLPVPITEANMSAPPPNYSSLDRYGHPRTDQGGVPQLPQQQQQQQLQAQGLHGLQGRRAGDVDTASIASTDSDESTTFLLGDAVLDLGDDFRESFGDVDLDVD